MKKAEPPRSYREDLMRKAILILTMICGFSSLIPAQKLDVKIINRENSEQSYAYATFYANTAAGATFQVSGATLTLQLPDSRVAVVNCSFKFAEHFAGPIGNRRSCHVPLVSDIRAEFHGDSAKLIWIVSLDGKKTQAETYRILAVMDSK